LYVPIRTEDLSVDGRVDTFSIQWPGYAAQGVLKYGNVVIGCSRFEAGG
jgi:hypothetical protein